MSNEKYDPPLSRAGFMDLAIAMQTQLETPDAVKVLAQMAPVQRQAAERLVAAAKSYIEAVELQGPTPVPFGAWSAAANAILQGQRLVITDPKLYD
jgi:hypothetical protein